MITQTSCPPVDTLKRYSLGQYSDDEGTPIEQHLNGCATCEASLANFDHSHDSLLRHLPLAGRRENHAESPGWMQRLLAGPPANGSIATDNVAEPEAVENGDTDFGAYELTGILGLWPAATFQNSSFDSRHRWPMRRPMKLFSTHWTGTWSGIRSGDPRRASTT